MTKSEINKQYYEKNKDKIKANRKRIEVKCPDCNVVRLVRKDTKRLSDRCQLCNIYFINQQNCYYKNMMLIYVE